MTAATVADWVNVYWSGLKTQLDTLNSSLYTELASDAAADVTKYDTGHLTANQLVRLQALLVCVECGGMSGLGGWSQERHLMGLKIADRTWKKDSQSPMDVWIGELCRLLKITQKQFLTLSSSTRAAKYNLYKTNSVYLAPPLDNRPSLGKDYDLQDARDEYTESSYERTF